MSNICESLSEELQVMVDKYPALINSEFQTDLKKNRLIMYTKDITEMKNSRSHARITKAFDRKAVVQ